MACFGTAQAQLQGSAPISAATQEAVYLRKLGASQAHLRMKDTSIDAAAQYIVHSDLGRVQARVPWAKPSILHGQVMKLPDSKSMPEHNQYSLLESSMAMTTAGMNPSINGNTANARSLSSYGKPSSSHQNADNESWGFNPDGVSSYAGGDDPVWLVAGGRRRTSPVPTTNPYIEMRRKRSDLSMVRYQLVNFGALSSEQNQPKKQNQHRPSHCHASLQNRLKTPDRQIMLNISQVPVPLDNSVDSAPALDDARLRSLVASLSPCARAYVLNSPDRASSQTVAEPVGLSQARKAAGAADRHSSSLRTPEIPNFISRRRLGALKDLSPTQHSKDSPTQHSKDSRPAADVVAATSHATSHAEERPVQHASMVDMQPDHPVQLSHPNSSLRPAAPAPPAPALPAPALPAQDPAFSSPHIVSPQLLVSNSPNRRVDNTPLSRSVVTLSLRNGGYTSGKNNSRTGGGWSSGSLPVTVQDSFSGMSPWDEMPGETSSLKPKQRNESSESLSSMMIKQRQLQKQGSFKQYVATEGLSQSVATQWGLDGRRGSVGSID